MAMPMLAALAPGLIPCLWFQVIRQYTVGMRRPKALLLITIPSVLINIGLNWVSSPAPSGFPPSACPASESPPRWSTW
ncbi:hypothetical protein [Rhodococcus opacus]|uniref:hypothetical protein n=1 Tax=Rhodococcus opacus TaxID=37919 RepID=UPI001F0B3CE0|nr:hypothetical protein [Rhodococcus opacus]